MTTLRVTSTWSCGRKRRNSFVAARRRRVWVTSSALRMSTPASESRLARSLRGRLEVERVDHVGELLQIALVRVRRVGGINRHGLALHVDDPHVIDLTRHPLPALAAAGSDEA